MGSLLLLLPGASAAAELEGRIDLVSARSGRPSRGVDLTETVVAFLAENGQSHQPSEEAYEMATVRKSFEPSSLVVRTGSTVIFPNFDPILHNVFSLTPENAFDLGHYGRGEGKAAQFTRPGLVRVFCNVHQDMYAHILVVDTPFHTRTDSDGSFRLSRLPAGGGKLVLWHPQTDLQFVESITTGSKVRFSLSVNRRRVPSHLNKLGKPYSKRRSRYGG